MPLRPTTASPRPYDQGRATLRQNRAISIRPGHAPTYYNRGNAYRRQNQDEKAIVEYTQAIKFDRLYYRAYTNRGVAHDKLGQRSDAIADYRKALEINPSSHLAKKGLERFGTKP